MSYSLHAFGHASSKAYCVAIYLVMETDSSSYICLLSSETKAAPLVKHSIPRLKLLSALIVAKLFISIKEALASLISVDFCNFWLDSLTALYWIKSKQEPKKFAQNRVNEILQLSSSGQWPHYKGTENQADLGAHGTTAAELKENQLWFHGSNWQGEGPNSWLLKDLSDLQPTQENLGEIRNIKLTKATTETISLQIAEFNIGVKLTELLNPTQFSKCRKLYIVTGFVLPFVNNLNVRI